MFARFIYLLRPISSVYTHVQQVVLEAPQEEQQLMKIYIFCVPPTTIFFLSPPLPFFLFFFKYSQRMPAGPRESAEMERFFLRSEETDDAQQSKPIGYNH